MPAKKGRSAPRPGPAAPQEPRGEPQPKVTSGRGGEEYLTAWVNFAKGLGDTTTDFARKLGEEQQRSYERWVAVSTDSVQPRPTKEDISEVTAKFQEWKELADEMGHKVAEALTTGTGVQKDLFAAWSHAGSPAMSQDNTSDPAELVQKFWAGLFSTAAEKYGQSFKPGVKLDDFVKSQEESVKELSENFRKFSYAYLTSPPFVTLFGKTLDATLEAQRALSEKGNLTNLFGGIPTKKDIADLQDALKEINQKVSRLEEKIR